MDCVKDRLVKVVKQKDFLEWIIGHGHLEALLEIYTASSNHPLVVKLACLYAKEARGFDEDHPDYEQYLEVCDGY